MRVLVTRPEPAASATAATLRAGGHTPVILPLSRIARLDQPERAWAGRSPDAVVGTSANGFHHAPRELAARYGHLPCFAVGERTATAADKAGFTYIRIAGGNAGSLAAMIKSELPADARLLYVCGAMRRPFLEEALEAEGFGVAVYETYRTEPIAYDPEEVEALFDSQGIDAVLVYSPFAAARYSLLAQTGRAATCLRVARLLCMSADIAVGLAEPLRRRAEIAERPDEASVLALLGRGR